MILTEIFFDRLVRTANSETFGASNEDGAFAQLDVHYGKSIYITVIIEKDSSEKEIGEFLDFFIDKFIGIDDKFSSNDIIVSVYKGNYVNQWDGYYSDSRVHLERSVQKLNTHLDRYIGRSEKALGNVATNTVIEYYQKKGYTVEKTPVDIDKEFKIDVIATKDDEMRLIQVKKGEVSSGEIKKIFKKGNMLFDKKYPIFASKIIEIVAKEFPSNYLKIRDSFEKGERLQFTHFYLILKKMSEYRFIYK